MWILSAVVATVNCEDTAGGRKEAFVFSLSSSFRHQSAFDRGSGRARFASQLRAFPPGNPVPVTCSHDLGAGDRTGATL